MALNISESVMQTVSTPGQLDTEATMKQFKEFLSSYNKLSQMCFIDCTHDFTTRKVLDSENTCSINCMEKYLKMTQRITQRFQEYQMQQSEGTPAIKGFTATT